MNAKKPLSIAIGTLAAVSFSLAASADQSGNPFEVEDLNQGMSISVGDDPKDEGKCGEGRCGEDKDKDEGSCGEGSCGEDKDEGSCGEGSCGEDKDDDEGKCGEGSCGAV